MLTPPQHPYPLPVQEFRQANGALRRGPGQLGLHIRRVHERGSPIKARSRRCIALELNTRHFTRLGIAVELLRLTSVAADEAADGGVEAEGADESREEDDEDHGGVCFELFRARVGPPSALVSDARWRCWRRRG